MNLEIQTTSNLRILKKVIEGRIERQLETFKKSEKELRNIQKILIKRGII